MTVPADPDDSDEKVRPNSENESVTRKPGVSSPVNLWDEHAAVSVVIDRDRSEDRKDRANS